MNKNTWADLAARLVAEEKHNLKHNDCLLALRQNDLFIVSQGKILAACVTPSMHTASQNPSFKHLNVPSLNFKPKDAVINSSGRLLAVLGDNQVLVVVLPTSAHIKSSSWSEMTCTTMRVGDYYYTTDTKNCVAKAQWHPLSKDFLHMAVLSSDGCLRLYNLSSDAKHPESTLWFNPFLAVNDGKLSRSCSRGFGLDPSSEIVAQSFCFGANHGYGKMTAYCVMKNGDIYSLCPVLPSHSILPRQVLNRLHETTLQLASSGTNGDGIERLNFLDNLLTNGVTSSAHASSLLVNYSYRHNPKPMPRGPYLLEPTPAEWNDEDATDVTIVFEDGLEVIAVASGSGRVDLFLSFANEPFWGPLDLEGLSGKRDEWDGNQDEGDLNLNEPWLLIAETVKLGDQTGAVHFASLPEDLQSILICYHDAGVHRLDCGNWTAELSSVLAAAPPAEIPSRVMELFGSEGVKNSGTWTNVRGIINSRPFAASRGAPISNVVVFDQAGSNSQQLIALTSDNLLIVQDLFEYRIRSKTSAKLPEAPRLLEALTLNESNIDPSLLASVLTELPIHQVLPFVKRSSVNGTLDVAYPIPNTGKIITTDSSILPPSKKDASTEVLRYPTGITPISIDTAYANSAAVRGHIKQMMNFISATQDRCDCLQVEIKRQEDLLTIATSPLAATKNEAVQSRIQTCKERMGRLIERADTMLQICMEVYSPSLSEYERKWGEEAKSMSRILEEFPARIQKLKNQMVLLHKDYQISSNSGTDSPMKQPNMGQHQLTGVARLVEEETRFIEDIRLRLRDLEMKLDLLD